MRQNNKYPKNNIFDSLINNSVDYSRNENNNHYNKTKKILDKFFKNEMLKNQKQTPVVNNYNIKKIPHNYKNKRNYLYDNFSKDDSFLKEFYLSTGDNIVNNNSFESNFIYKETYSDDKIIIKNLNRVTIAILKENIPVSYFNDILNEPFNLKNNISKDDLYHNFILEENNNRNNYNYNIDFLSNEKKLEDINKKVKHTIIKNNKTMSGDKKNITKLFSSKSYNKNNKIFYLKHNKKINKNKNQKEKSGSKKKPYYNFQNIKKDSYIQREDNKNNSNQNKNDIGIDKFNYKYKTKIYLDNKNRLSTSNEKNSLSNMNDCIGKKIKIQNIKNKKMNNKIYSNISIIRKEKDINMISKFCLTENNNNKNDKKFKKIISKNNIDYSKYNELKIKNNFDNESYTLNKNYKSSKIKINTNNNKTNKNKTEYKTYLKLRNYKGKKSSYKNCEKNEDKKNNDKKCNNYYNTNFIIKDKKIKSQIQSNKIPIFKENKIYLPKRDLKLKKLNNSKKLKITMKNRLKRNFDNNIKLDIYLYENESLENRDICNRPFISDYIQTPFFTQK